MIDVAYGKTILLLGMIITVIIRIPHLKNSIITKITQSRIGSGEISLLILGALSFAVLPILLITTPLFSWANYTLYPLCFYFGIAVLVLNFWLSYKAHKDLGKNWSPTLQIRQEHRLVDTGVYAQIRHPIYTAFFLYGIAQCLLLSNWIVGPSFLLVFTGLFIFRVGREERMMLDQFGDQYFQYMKKTKRLLPYVY